MMIVSEKTIPEQSGRVALVTGAAGGLGFEIARMLAGDTITPAARDAARALLG